MCGLLDEVRDQRHRLGRGMPESFGFGVFHRVKIKAGFLLLVTVPFVFSVFSPAVQDRLKIKLPIGTHERGPLFSPDKAGSELKARIIKSIVKNTRFRCGIKLIDRGVFCHCFFETGKSLHEEVVSFFIGEIIVFDLSGRGFEVHKIRCVRADEIHLGIAEQCLVCLGIG